MRKVIFVQGGGLGLDQELSVRRLFEAANVPVEFEVHLAGRTAQSRAPTRLPKSTFDAVRECGIALKTKLLQPMGGGTPTARDMSVPTNYNVAFRRNLGLFASMRPVHNLPGIPSRFSGVDFLLFREITEDLYTASEHELVPGVVQSFKIVTEVACMRFFKLTFETARAGPQVGPLHPQGEHPQDGRRAVPRLLPPRRERVPGDHRQRPDRR